MSAPTPMTVEQVLSRWGGEHPALEGDLVHVERVLAREAGFDSLDPPLPPVLEARLAERGVSRLYRHQVSAIERIRSGVDTVVVAGTASGKSLCYQVPIVERLLEDRRSTSLLLYPTKALAQDQLGSFRRLRLPEVSADTYDGDTPTDDRRRIRRRSNVVLTNPDMLHMGILPFHSGWADFLHRLAFVVVDEMHTLKGIFGTHVSMILRRLVRLAAHYGASPTFVLGSATIGNPRELAEGLCGRPVEVVDQDASPRGEQHVALWNPPVVDEGLNRRRSSLAEATDVLVDLVRSDLHTIAFTRSRKATELMYRWASERLQGDPRRERIAPYRAGYLPTQRRATEARLFSGELLGVVATNALELGIDVGSLDAAVITTFPGTISAFRQQAGRAGRARQESLVVLVGGEDALDQYFMTHPSQLFTRPPEAGVINPSNPSVAEGHAACAAHELPLVLEDREVLGDAIEEAANRLVQQGLLRLREGRLHWAGRGRPAPTIDIRASGGGSFTILTPSRGGWEALGVLDRSRVFRDAHEGAVYLHQGETYVVEELDPARSEVRVRPASLDHYTEAKEEKVLEVLELQAKGRIGEVGHHLGTVRVESHVVAYQRRRLGSRELLETVPLDLPPTVFETEGIWLTLPDRVLRQAGLEAHSVPGSLHAAEHAGIAMLPLMAICDRWDLGGLSTPWHPQTGTAAIFIYEAYPGGAGISPVAYGAGEAHLRATVEAVRSCPCQHGCPSCVQSPKCGNFNEPLDKDGAIRLLDAVLAGTA